MYYFKNNLGFFSSRKMTMDENHKAIKGAVSKPKKARKTSQDEIQMKFESLMKSGETMEIEVRMMDSKLRKLNRKQKKSKTLKSIMKVHDMSKKKKPKNKVAFDLIHIEYI